MQMKERETDEIFTIGVIDFSNCDDSLNEGYRGSFGNGLNNCSIVVRGNEGMYPHCHVISKDSSFQCCPCLDKAVYFNHREYQGKFTPKQKKVFNDWMKLPAREDPSKTNWQMLCMIWNYANDVQVIHKDRNKQPDYTRLENMIG